IRRFFSHPQRGSSGPLVCIDRAAGHNRGMAGGSAVEHATQAKTLAEMTVECARRYEGAALKYKENDEWVELSYGDLGDAVMEIAGGLVDLGIEPKERVAILSDTRPEWTLADLGGI